MFGPDPIDLFDPSPYGGLAYYGHLVIGTFALLAALAAFASRKGSRFHRQAGYLFLATVGIVCLTSVVMLFHAFVPPLFMAVFTAIYAMGGAYLALQRGTRTVRKAETSLTLFEIIGVVLFLAQAIPAVQQGTIPAFGPVVILIIPALLLVGDANWFLRHKDRAKLRLARHFSRMVWAFIVVLRAPLVELVAGGLPVPAPVVIIGPIVLGIAMLWYFRRRFVRQKPVKS